ncbi:MAG: glycosyltransferase [Treponema sp.]|nr:glycosyltransferase [Treponema sp.]MCL2245113.1 glycosyltransferase [Treponema sp.]
MDLLDIYRYGHFIFFTALQTALMAGVFLEWLRDKKSKFPCGAKVSVIIPIHNESARMERLLETLLHQSCKAQIIFIDDRSADESPAMLEKFSMDAAELGVDCRIITLTENPGLNRKQFAIARGIDAADGDFLLFTDGDCEVPPDWINEMASRMNGKTGAAIGPVFKKKQDRGFFQLYQCYDHAVRYNYLAGAIGLGAAGGGFGNNLIIDRKALDKVGGYDAVPPSPTEDAALISLIRASGLGVRAITSTKAAVETESEKKWGSFINQTLRWNNGGLFSPEIVTCINYNILMLLISASILAIPFLPFIPKLWPVTAAVYVVMIENTIGAFGLFRSKLPKGGIFFMAGYFLTYVFMPVYMTLMTLMGYLRIKTTWKNNEMK